jgi:predicted NAD/FAD-binding protein
MGSAIWSMSLNEMLAFPAASFVRFFANHRLINSGKDRPQWRTVSGGSREYVKKLSETFSDRIRLNTEVASVVRHNGYVLVRDVSGREEKYDHVILGCHSDEALKMLGDPSQNEKKFLGAIRYGPNKAYLHRDTSLMPQRTKAWASWNYMRNPDGHQDAEPASVTYWMNRLQNIDNRYPLFVSLNPAREPDPDLMFATFDYMHPMYDTGALAAQERLGAIQGEKNTWFCGAYFGYGFHEDGLVSGLNVAERLGAVRPWDLSRPTTSQLPLPMAAE